MLHKLVIALPLAMLAASQPAQAQTFQIKSNRGAVLNAQAFGAFDQPWAMTFLPDGRALVTTKPGKMFLVAPNGGRSEVAGLWPVAYGGQGGLGDVIAHPRFASNAMIYVSFADPSAKGAAAAVVRARLDIAGDRAALRDVQRIWTQSSRGGGGHFGHRMAFSPDGKLFITAGDRQRLSPAQDFSQSLGKIIRLNEDGSVPADNPFQDRGELAKTFWTLGHRNPLGLAFDAAGRLWAHEMGPAHGDEFNLILPGRNYGWPLVSQGRHYSGEAIPPHSTRRDMEPPKAFWVPAISPAGLIIYSGAMFADWRGHAFAGGLSSRALVRIAIEGDSAKEAERFTWGQRVREIEQSSDGAIWVLEDGRNGRLLKLTQ